MNPHAQSLFDEIPPAKAMGIAVSKQWENGLELCAPFECSRNDKGTAFAGSIASILTLAGWGLLTLQLREQNPEADIMIVTNKISYNRPVKQTLYAVAEISASELERIRNDLQFKQRSRVHLLIRLIADGRECAVAAADYAIIQGRRN